ncbi:hypothetical protein [Oceanivirga salmonicida]|uniref:hypothetical protein n=1 Tax=Oceanivirga salmonicida TaxID=1769291 RepID=UPI00082C3760|nr:hypothetical protein [Oceanivirga salmonicida]
MNKENWYRNTIWNEEIEKEFENRLKRSRGNYNKSQYLRIQATYLLSSSNEIFEKKGIELMERVINFYSDEFDSITAKEQLGDFYFSKKDFVNAEYYFRIVTEYYYTKTRSGTSGLADLKLCELILLTNQKDKFKEAYKMGIEKFDREYLSFDNEKFYYNNLMANLCYAMNRKNEASKFASIALELSKITRPKFSRHKMLGLVNATEEQIEKLKMILN